jgi:hypothetical protein
MLNNDGEVRVGSDDQNGPKRRIWRCLGHRYVFFCSYYFMCFLRDDAQRPQNGPDARRLGPNDRTWGAHQDMATATARALSSLVGLFFYYGGYDSYPPFWGIFFLL